MNAILRLDIYGEMRHNAPARIKFSRCTSRNEKKREETIGSAFGDARKSFWCAEIIGLHPVYGFDRKFLKPKYDYDGITESRMRGAVAEYVISSKSVYEVKSCAGWGEFRRYFCTANQDGDVIEISKKEVYEWIKNH